MPSAPGQAPPPGSARETAAPDYVEVGRVIDAYGIRGWLKIAPFNDPEDSVLLSCRSWRLSDGRTIDIDSARVHGATVVAKPLGFEDRDIAIRCKGMSVSVRRADFPAGEGGEFYWVDLIGCEVANPAGESLGAVESIEDYGAHPILKLVDANGVRRMIPFVDSYIVDVALAERRIVADWPLEI